MKISIFGTGYVGLVTGVCFAEMGNSVICADIDHAKIKSLNEGKSPIYEPGLDELLSSNIKSKRIQFTTNLQEAVEKSDLLFIAVGTPMGEDGSSDLKYVMQVAETISTSMTAPKLIINKSTVPVGTAHKVKQKIQEILAKRNQNISFDVISNPEFLKEGAAINDCLRPNRIVVGHENPAAKDIMVKLYRPFFPKDNEAIFCMDLASAELTKYAANAMLATKISFINQISQLCEKVGADVENIRLGIGSDPRIGSQFLYAGVGYGGSCFPKDVRALIKTAEEFDFNFSIIKAVEESNFSQREFFFKKIMHHFNKNIVGKKLALWGLAFKPGTDDVREAPSLYLIEKLLQNGASLTVFDPVAASATEKLLGNRKGLVYSNDQYEVLESSDALIIVTDWKSFKEPDFDKIKANLNNPVVFDGRNLYSIGEMKNYGFEYISIGRI